MKWAQEQIFETTSQNAEENLFLLEKAMETNFFDKKRTENTE